MAYGRPLKGNSRRMPITVHVPVDLLAVIDDFVAKQEVERGTVYSRSDFYNEAAIALLQSSGVAFETERTKSVP